MTSLCRVPAWILPLVQDMLRYTGINSLCPEVCRILASVELGLLRFGSERRRITCKTKLHQVSQLINTIHNFLPNTRILHALNTYESEQNLILRR